MKKNNNYHVVLGSPTMSETDEDHSTVRPRCGGNQSVRHHQVGTYGFGAMDGQINNYIAAHSEITPDQFVFFVSHNIFLTSGGCCIGGYHYGDEYPAGWPDLRLHHAGHRSWLVLAGRFRGFA